MQSSIHKLYKICNKPHRKIIGLMSGTSLDGLDIALCNISENGKSTKVELINFTTIPYESAFKEQIGSIFSKPIIESEKLCLLNAHIGKTHAHLINETLIKWGIKNEEIDLIASHGQTIYHAPKSLHQLSAFGNGTLQIGDGDQIAVNTKIITLYDFRQKHIAAGGEGAPLATYGDYLLFSDATKSRILLNIGGIANLTFIPADSKFDKITATDTGPGNTLMNMWAKKHFNGAEYDKDAAIAINGNVNLTLLHLLLKHPFFNQPFPKTTGPEIFNLELVEASIDELNLMHLSPEDIMATLNEFTATSICNAIHSFTSNINEFEIIISGGGVHNPLLFSKIRQHFTNQQVYTSSDYGINADAKEAILFAILANETVSGNSAIFQTNNKSMPNISMGKICLTE